MLDGDHTYIVEGFVVHNKCCVVATALTQQNQWSPLRLAKLEVWALKKLDTNIPGIIFHKGYHIIGSKILIPILNTKGILSKYITWSFNNATNMLQGKKYSKLSIPNSLIWMSTMFITGLFVSKEQAERSWKSLYRNRKK